MRATSAVGPGLGSRHENGNPELQVRRGWPARAGMASSGPLPGPDAKKPAFSEDFFSHELGRLPALAGAQAAGEPMAVKSKVPRRSGGRRTPPLRGTIPELPAKKRGSNVAPTSASVAHAAAPAPAPAAAAAAAASGAARKRPMAPPPAPPAKRPAGSSSSSSAVTDSTHVQQCCTPSHFCNVHISVYPAGNHLLLSFLCQEHKLSLPQPWGQVLKHIYMSVTGKLKLLPKKCYKRYVTVVN